MIVSKFGGSSLASAAQIKKVFDIVSENPERKAVVVSAPGKRADGDVKVTDLLIKCAESHMAGKDSSGCLNDLLGRYSLIISELGLDGAVFQQIESDLKARLAAYGGYIGGGKLRPGNDPSLVSDEIPHCCEPSLGSDKPQRGSSEPADSDAPSLASGEPTNRDALPHGSSEPPLGEDSCGGNPPIGEAAAGGGAPLSRGEFLDLMKAAGEDNCAKLVAAYFNSRGVPAVYADPGKCGFLLSENFGDAHVLPETYGNLAATLGRRREVIVFPGFFGYTKSGKVITFSRGGSDITGSILAAALNAELYENFTDVDSVYSVDPKLVAEPCPIREITYREMRELSYAGFSVYHEDALVPVFAKGIPVHIKNTNNLQATGTVILAKRDISAKRPVIGISAASGFISINMSKLLMNAEVGFGRKALSIIEDENISFEHMPSGIDNISLILKESAAPPDVRRRVTRRLMAELAVDEISVRPNLAIVMLVGEGMLNSVGTTARASMALAKANINIEIINQGASEVSLMFGIDEKYASQAVKSLYDEFF
jgi:aspartate kinase